MTYIAEGFTKYLLIRVTSFNSMDYNLSEEDALGMQLQLSPILLNMHILPNIYTPLNFNKEDN